MIRSMVVVLAVLCLVFAGCGDDKDGDKNGDKNGGNGKPNPILPGGGGGDDGGDDGGGGSGGTGSGGSAAGTYVLDTAQMTPLIEEMMLKGMQDELAEMPEGQREMALNMAKASIKPMIAAMNFDVALNDDGTFSVKGSNMDGQMNVKGTWKQDGSDIWFKTTMEDGVEKDEEAKRGTLKDGDIHFKPEDDMPFALIFKRK